MKMGFYQRLGFRNKLIFSFVLVSLLPVLVVQMIYYNVSSKAFETKTNELVHYNLIQTAKSLDNMLASYEDIVFQVFTNDEVVELIRNINAGNDVELSKNKLVNILSSYSYAKEGIRSAAIFTSNGTLICYDQQTGSPYQNLWTSQGASLQSTLYRQVMEQKGPIIMTLPTKTDPINNKEQYVFHIARKINDFKYNTGGIGVIVFSLYESVLSNAVNLESEPVDREEDRIRSFNYLIDQNNKIASSPDKSLIGQDIAVVDQKDMFRNDYRENERSLRIINITNKKDLFREMYTMQRISILTGVSALLISTALITYLSESLSKSIKTILRAMKTAQKGTLTVQIDDESRDEMSLIASSFNNMMNTINELMVESRQAVLKQKESEIRVLEAQINPHFLYNTLDSINWLAIEKEEHQISEMLKSLAQILRYSIKDSNKMVTINEELNWMKKYIFLQQYRFNDSFTCDVQYDDHVINKRIYKLLIQPFIENSIIHGFSGISKGGKLEISVTAVNESALSIVIKDNGRGIAEADLQFILHDHAEDVSGRRIGMGMRNATDRLAMYYGNKASYEITSTLGEGTRVELIVPAINV
jgi:two-component system, sensor histidine kinase YesM